MILAARGLALIAYLALLGLILVWTTWIDPPEIVPISVALVILVLPLLFPLRGMLHGRRYTHAWSSLLALAYVTLGITLAAAADARLYGLLMTAASLAWFAGCLLYVKLDARRARQIAS
ncbi:MULTISPECIES: DUF2069 domain-containing protein [unclassified Thioalkalivibrio]|uniref:DUF2069 domain-containing protein n=1 Tax=unclassified Thioalkalivibrio TaxID=2621013 RepID=UPI00035DB8A6|nr:MULTISPECIES: DUF2069 domain-containing protein [unclassified Thioalkalivibrio]